MNPTVTQLLLIVAFACHCLGTTTTTNAVTTTTTSTSTSTTTTRSTTPEPNLNMPSIKTVENNIVVSVPEGSQLELRYFDENGETTRQYQIATITDVMDLESRFDDKLFQLEQLMNNKIDTLESDLKSDIATKTPQIEHDNLVDLVKSKADETSVENQFEDVDDTLDDLQSQINTKAANSELQNVKTTLNQKADQSSLTQLSEAVNTKASKSSVTALETLVVADWPDFEDFEGVISGWNGNNAQVKATQCGAIGKILGGYRVSSGASYVKTFNLPIHHGVRIELDYIFIDSWDVEMARVVVDGDIIWSQLHSWSYALSHENQCGRSESRFAEHVVHVDVTIWDHTATTLTLTVQALLNDNADDEAFGIDNVFIHEATPSWPRIQLFDGDVMGWKGANTAECGLYGSVLGEPGQVKSGATLSRFFSHLPGHEALRLSLDLILIDDWTDEEVLIKMDGQVVWQGNGGSPLGNMCGGGDDDSVVSIDVTLDRHTASTLLVEIVSTLPSSSSKSFAIAHVTLNEPSSTWPALEEFEGADPQNHGWVSNGMLDTTNCGSFGSILGGFNLLGVGRYVEKTFYNLPSHTGLQVELDIALIDSWDGERALVLVDGVVVWQSQAHSGAQGDGHECGYAHSSGWKDDRQHVNVIIPLHTANQVTLRVTTTLSSAPNDESFGIDNVLIRPAPELWPEVDTFEDSTDGWRAHTTAATKTYECGPFGKIFGGYNVLGRNSFAMKTYQNLPSHRGLRVEMDFLFIDSWDNEEVIITLDGRTMHRRRQSGGITNVCGRPDRSWSETIDHLVFNLPDHTASTLTIRVSATIDGAANDESYGVDNIKIGPLVYEWPDVDDFEYSYAGWSGAALSTCGGTRLLGGYNRAAAGTRLRKTYNDLPEHQNLIIEFDFHFIDTWDTEDAWLNVDGKRVWTSRYYNNGNNPSVCGNGAADYKETFTVRVQGHVSSSASLEFGTNLNSNAGDESFGVDNIQLSEG